MKLLKQAEVAEILNISVDVFRKIVKHQPNFPRPFKVHPTARPKWLDTDIQQYLDRAA